MKNNLLSNVFIALVSVMLLLVTVSHYLQLTFSPDLSLNRSTFGPTQSLGTNVEAGKAVPRLNLLPEFQRVDNLGSFRQYNKLSGIVFHPQQKTLFAVSDRGDVLEIAANGALIQEKEIDRGLDFEGIAYNPTRDLLYMAIEGEEAILEVDPDTLETGRKIPIDLTFNSGVLLTRGGRGIEGITFVPGRNDPTNGTFYLVNQSKYLEGIDASIVFEVEIDDTANTPKARITRYFSVGITDLSGIHYIWGSDHLLLISDANNLLMLVSLSGKVLGLSPLPGDNQEGVTVDGNGFLYIAQDKDSQLLKFRPVQALPNREK